MNSKKTIKEIFANLAKIKTDQNPVSFFIELGRNTLSRVNEREHIQYKGVNVEFPENVNYTLVDFKLLHSIVKKAICENFTFRVDEGNLIINNKFVIKCMFGSSSFYEMGKIRCHIDEGFIVSNELKTSIQKAVNFSSKNELRPTLTGVILKGDEIAATDAHLLYKNKVKDLHIEGDGIILPPSIFKFLKLFDKIAVANNEFLSCTGNNYTYECALIAGRYPNYNFVIPSREYENIIIVNKKELTNILYEALLMADIVKLLITFTIYRYGVNYQSIDKDFDRSYSIDVGDCTGDIIQTLSFKIPSLLKILNCCDDDIIEIHYSENNNSVILKSKSKSEEVFLIMPIK